MAEAQTKVSFQIWKSSSSVQVGEQN